MCLVSFAYRCHPDYELVIAANRDEFHARPTAKAAWRDSDTWFGGRDLQAGGTWLAISRGGRFATVTNFRRPGDGQGSLSRGSLPVDFVRAAIPPAAYVESLASTDLSGFNLLLFDQEYGLVAASNRSKRKIVALSGGVGAISNGDLDESWPKMSRATATLRDWCERGETAPERLLAALKDQTVAESHELPDTGVGPEIERFLSSVFIRSEDYGTRASTVVMIGQGRVRVVELSFDPDGQSTGRIDQQWTTSP